jgi:hypothetical protein
MLASASECRRAADAEQRYLRFFFIYDISEADRAA